MAVERIKNLIIGDSPGKVTEMNGYRIGKVGGKKVYMQGAMHTDEQPGMMALIHLLPMLIAADDAGELEAEFVLFPMVNPIGMGNIQFGSHQGRYDVPTGVNFNRDWPDMWKKIANKVGDQLGQDEAANVAAIRKATKEWLDTPRILEARDQLRHYVMQEAYDADYVLDLHCDDESPVYFYCAEHCAESIHTLSNYLHGKAVMMADDSGGGSFDEVFSLVWINARSAHADLPIPIPVVASTLELRGQTEVTDEIGKWDAEAIYGYLQAEGLIGGAAIGDPIESPTPTQLVATQMVKVDRPGLVTYHVEIGDQVKKGDLVAIVIALDGEDPYIERTPFYANTDGLVLSRTSRKYVWPGYSIIKIVGTEPLVENGEYLLED